MCLADRRAIGASVSSPPVRDVDPRDIEKVGGGERTTGDAENS